MTSDQAHRRLFVILATLPGRESPEYLHRDSVLSAAWTLTADIRQAASFANYGLADRVLEQMADFGAFPDYLLSVAEVERIGKGNLFPKGRKT